MILTQVNTAEPNKACVNNVNLMTIKEQILTNNSKKRTISIVNFIGADESNFKKLISLFLGFDIEITKKSAWVFSYCIESNPDLIRPYHNILIKVLKNKQSHSTLRRMIMRAYMNAPISNDYESILFELCIQFLIDSNEPITLKVYSMATALRIVSKYPDLKNELQTVIEMGIESGSPAYLAWSRKILKKLNLINQT